MRIFILLVTVFFSTVAFSQEAKVVLRSTVIGNQEQPKVLYIVPWQQASSPELIYQPVQTLVDGVFEEVERGEFLRELRYRNEISASMPAK
jgi:hypothetical protein